MSIVCAAGIAVLGHAAARRTDWRWVLLLRAVGGVVLAALLVHGSGVTTGQGARTPLLILCGAAATSIALYFYALARIPPADAMVLRGASPLWIALGAWLVLGQSVGKGLWLSLVCGFAGLVLIQQPHLASGNLGAIAGAASGALLAIAQHALRRLRHVSARLIVLLYSCVILVIALGVVASARNTLTGRGLDDPLVVGMSLGTALLGTVGTIAVTRAIAVSTVQTVGVVDYAAIGLAAMADFAWFGLTPSAIGAIGLALTVVPAVIITFQRPKQRRIYRARLVAAPQPSEPDVTAIEEAIARAEDITSCELRVHLARDREPLEPARLEQLFASLGMTETKLRNGILIAVSAGTNEVCVVADAGVLEVSSSRVLTAIASTIAERIDDSGLARGIDGGLAMAANHLRHWFPVQADDIDELSNEVSLGYHGG